MREYFCAYHSMLGAMRKLSDAECGRLFRALLKYSAGDELDNLQGREEVLFDVFSQQIDRDTEKYEQKCSKNRASVNKRYQSNTNECDCKQSNTNVDERTRTNANEYQSYQDKDKDKDIPPKSPKGDERFEKFWSAYPRKEGKGNARKAFIKLKVSDSLLATMLEAIEVHKRSYQWQRDNGQYIPHPATWLNQTRWEDTPQGIPFEPDTFDEEVPPPFDGNWESMYG